MHKNINTAWAALWGLGGVGFALFTEFSFRMLVSNPNAVLTPEADGLLKILGLDNCN
jgi:hypothetical protein